MEIIKVKVLKSNTIIHCSNTMVANPFYKIQNSKSFPQLIWIITIYNILFYKNIQHKPFKS